MWRFIHLVFARDFNDVLEEKKSKACNLFMSLVLKQNTLKPTKATETMPQVSDQSALNKLILAWTLNLVLW